MCKEIENVGNVEAVREAFADIEPYVYGIIGDGKNYELIKLIEDDTYITREVVGKIVVNIGDSYTMTPIGTTFKGRRDIWNVFETFAILHDEDDAEYEAESCDLPILFGETAIEIWENRRIITKLAAENEKLETEKNYLEKNIRLYKRGFITLDEL